MKCESIKVDRLIKAESQRMIDKAEEELKFYKGKESMMSDFDHFCVESDRKIIAKHGDYVRMMTKNHKNHIYLVSGTPIPYEVGDMLFALSEKKPGARK